MIRNVLILGLFVLASCQTVPKPDRSTMAMGFAEATYGLGIELEGEHAVVSRDTLIRWQADEPIQLVIKGEPAGTELHQLIAAEMQQLFQLAGLTLEADSGLYKQLLRFTVKNDSLLVDDEIKTTCYAQYDYIKDGHLRTVDIVATRGALASKKSNCLLHEGMHALGFAGHPHRLHSVLSYTHSVKTLSAIDRRLIQMLYSEDLSREMPVGDALTVAYSRFTDFYDSREKRYVPRDISLEVRESESPLILAAPFSSGLSKQFYYQTRKNGTMSVDAGYGLRGSGQTFADLKYIKLSSGRIFSKQYKFDEFYQSYESTLGKVTLIEKGDVMHPLGRLDYALIETPVFSCVVVLEYMNASNMDIGGHELLYGNFCTDVSSPLTSNDARQFVGAIRVYERDPIEIRERSVATGQENAQRIAAIRMTGKWPVDDSYISGLKLMLAGETSGKVKIGISGEVCDGQMTNIQSNGLGKWHLTCVDNESASGRFSWDSDGTVSFRGETSTTTQPISWKGYQVF